MTAESTGDVTEGAIHYDSNTAGHYDTKCYVLAAGEYTLGENIELDRPILVTGAVTINLGTYTLTKNAPEDTDDAKKALSSYEGTYYSASYNPDAEYNAICVQSGGTLTINAGDGGKIVSSKAAPESTGNPSYVFDKRIGAIKLEGTGSLTMTGGTIDSKTISVCVNSTGTVNISNSALTIGENKSSALACENSSGANIAISNSTLTSGNIAVHAKARQDSSGTNTITISNSTLTGEVVTNNTTDTVTVSSSTITSSRVGISNNAGTITVENSTISSTATNSKSESTGIGISNAPNATIALTNSTVTSNGHGVKNEGTLTVSGDKTSISGTSFAAIQNLNSGSATISGGSISSSGYHAIQEDSGSILIEGGTITSTGEEMHGIWISAGDVSITSGTVTGTLMGILNEGSGNVNISGGSVTGKGHAGVLNAEAGKIIVSGNASITSDVAQGIWNNTNGEISISGGNVTGETYGVINMAAGTATISGGTIEGGTGDLGTKSTSTENIGYTITNDNLPTFKSNKLLSADSTLLKYDSGTTGVYIIGAKDWNATTTENQFFYMSTTDDINGTKEFTLDNLTSTSNVNVDSDNKVVGVPTSDIVSGETVELTDAGGYKLATVKYNNDKSAATVATFADDVSITSAVLGNTVATVSGVENSYTLYIGGSDTLKAMTGGDKNDTLVAGDKGATLNGGEGADSLVGGNGADLFIYTAGVDSISGYNTGDIVTLNGFTPTDATFTSDANNVSLTFGNSDKLVFEAVNNYLPISLQSGNNIYTYTKDYYALNGKSVTLPAGFVGTSFAAGDYFDTVDASAVTSAISIAGNANDNVIIAGASATLNGGAGNDLLNVSERNKGSKFTFEYTAGKDSVNGFDENNDQLDIDNASNITSAKASSGKLVFNFSDKNNVLTFKGDDIEKVSLNGGGFLTKNGAVTANSFKLFASAKGRIDLTDAPYKDAGITAVDASAAKKQSVTLTGGEQGSTFTFAENKKKDLFEYTGGSVSLTNYEVGRDRINLGNYAINGFKVDGNNVSLNVAYGENSQVMSIVGAAKSEVLIHDANGKSNSYPKTVFYADGVLQNKAKRPTAATVSAGAGNYTADNSIKKIYVTGGVSGIAITVGNNKTLIDASEADGGKTVTLTNQFSGTYNLAKNDGVSTVDGSEVKKNLTYKGTTAAESLVGGTKKTTFKAGGGGDTLVGGTGKDIFFYAKGDKDNNTIQSFDFTSDKIKIANGTLKNISTMSGGGIQFTVQNSKTDDSTAGSFRLVSSIGGGGSGETAALDTSKVFIKANNTYYWFAKDEGTGDNDKSYAAGDLITASTKVTKAQANATGYAIIDLGYSTNLAKSTVAIKAGEFTFAKDSITKK